MSPAGINQQSQNEEQKRKDEMYRDENRALTLSTMASSQALLVSVFEMCWYFYFEIAKHFQ